MPGLDRTSEALIDESSMEEVTQDYGPQPEAGPAHRSVTIHSYGRNEVKLHVEADRNGVVVLHDLYYPGWEVYVDGVQRPLLRANLLFRGVEVPAGRHHVEFRFRPLSVNNLVAAATDIVSGDGKEAGDTATQ